MRLSAARFSLDRMDQGGRSCATDVIVSWRRPGQNPGLVSQISALHRVHKGVARRNFIDGGLAQAHIFSRLAGSGRPNCCLIVMTARRLHTPSGSSAIPQGPSGEVSSGGIDPSYAPPGPPRDRRPVVRIKPNSRPMHSQPRDKNVGNIRGDGTLGHLPLRGPGSMTIDNLLARSRDVMKGQHGWLSGWLGAGRGTWLSRHNTRHETSRRPILRLLWDWVGLRLRQISSMTPATRKHQLRLSRLSCTDHSTRTGSRVILAPSAFKRSSILS